MFEPGDNYIHFTKYGGVNKGKVKIYDCTHVIDTKNLICYLKPHIVTTNNIVLELDGSDGKIFKVEKEYVDGDAKRIAINFEKITENRFKK
jgi:hypothetical protein